MNIKPIETTYNGYRFRSRLEARTAVFLDAAHIPYSYEPEGFVFEDGTTYLPDFFLPDQDTFLECKGVMGEKDENKIMQLAKATEKAIIIINPDLTIFEASYVENKHEYFPWENEKEGLYTEEAALGKCCRCGKKFFFGVNGSWACRCCGYYDGDNTADWLYYPEGYIVDYEPAQKAKKARFEYGEAG